MEGKAAYGHLILRVFLGILFLIPGLMKIMDPAGPVGMLQSLGFPAPALLGWILILSEIIFGAALIVGWKVKYAVWPLVIVLVVALLAVGIPGIDSTNPGSMINILWHLVGIGGLLSLYFTGPGATAIKSR